MLETGFLPDEEERLKYERTKRSPFVGMFVHIRKRDKLDHNTNLAKGRYGYVTVVDEEKKTARVMYNGREDVFPLRSLISL